VSAGRSSESEIRREIRRGDVTDLLYLPANEYERAFEATVTAVDEQQGTVALDRTLFYKAGGGQPPDHGVIEWDGGRARVTDVRQDHGEVRHTLDNSDDGAAPADGGPASDDTDDSATGGDLPTEGERVRGAIDWERRYAHMRHHTAQHVVSKVVLDRFGASTAGNQLYTDRARIDFEPADFDSEDLRAIEDATNDLLEADLAVEKELLAREELEARTPEGRTNLDLIPASVDPLRAVFIGDRDVCPCGGTHVRSLGELGPVEIVERTSKGAAVDRIEFVLGDSETSIKPEPTK
jgi:misacylated tRNA(Ala) deacylase